MHRLVQMQNSGKDNSVRMYSVTHYSKPTRYYFEFEGQTADMKISLKADSEQPDEALTKLHAKWLSLTSRVPELLGALPPPAPTPDEDSQDGDQFVNVPPANALDDDIPF